MQCHSQFVLVDETHLVVLVPSIVVVGAAVLGHFIPGQILPLLRARGRQGRHRFDSEVGSIQRSNLENYTVYFSFIYMMLTGCIKYQ